MKRFTAGSVSVAACTMCLALSCQLAFAAEVDGASASAGVDAPIVRVADQPIAAEAPASLVADSFAAADGEDAFAIADVLMGDAAMGADAEKIAGADADFDSGKDDSSDEAGKDVASDADKPSASDEKATENGTEADEGSDVEHDAVAPDYHGWVTDETGTYFYDDGALVTGDRVIDSELYHFDDETGAMVHGWLADESGEIWRYFSQETGILQRGEVYLPSEDDEGVGADGRRYWYYLDDIAGVRLYGWQWVESASKWAYYDVDSGRRLFGQQYLPCGNDDGDEYHWYYFDKATGATQYGWQWLAEESKWVYYEPTFGWMDYGEQCLLCDNADGAPSYWYHFDENTGAVTYGWQWLGSGEKWVCYEQVTGKMLYGQQLLHANAADADYHWYLFDSETGAAAHGLAWVRDEHKGVLYDQVMGWMLYGWHDVDGVSYHLREGDGALIGVRCANGYVSNYVTWMLEMAADDSHGYDQGYRWGERGDYDCSSLVVSSLRASGFETGGATYTGNMVYNLTRNGFSWLGDFSNLQVGDILLNEEVHTAVYLGGGLLVHASGNEWGGALGGQPGDQTGTEICVRSYFWEPWDGYLRYRG